MNDTCICDNVPKVWRLTGVTRTLRLRIFNPDGTPLDLTGRTVGVTIARDNSEFVYAPGFVIEGDDNNVVKFEWPADQQGAGDYTINVTTTDGSGNADRVNWHGPTGIRLVDFSFMVRGEDALGVTSEANIGLDGTFTMNGTGMSAYDEWLAEGHTGTPEDFIAWLRQPAEDAATEAVATVDAKMAEVDADMAAIEATAAADHTRAESDHTTATGDHTRAEADHVQAVTDSQQAATDHHRAEIDAAAAASDREKAATDRTKAANDRQQAAVDHGTAAQDHATASSDHQQAQSDHSTASADHTKATQDAERAASDHTRAGDDHDTAVADHQQAEADHTRAEADHTTAAADHITAANDHTQATADHEVMAGYDTRLGNVEGEVSQLGQKVGTIVLSKDELAQGSYYANSLKANTKRVSCVKYLAIPEDKTIQVYSKDTAIMPNSFRLQLYDENFNYIAGSGTAEPTSGPFDVTAYPTAKYYRFSCFGTQDVTPAQADGLFCASNKEIYTGIYPGTIEELQTKVLNGTRMAILNSSSGAPLQFSTTNKTCTLPSCNMNYNNTRKAVSAQTVNLAQSFDGYNVYSYSILVYDLANNIVKNFDSDHLPAISDDYLLLAVVVGFGSNTTPKPQVSSPSMYTIDGYKNGIDLSYFSKVGIVNAAFGVPLQFSSENKNCYFPAGQIYWNGRKQAYSAQTIDMSIGYDGHAVYSYSIIVFDVASATFRNYNIDYLPGNIADLSFVLVAVVVGFGTNPASSYAVMISTPSMYSIDGVKYGIPSAELTEKNIEILRPCYDVITLSSLSAWSDFIIITINGVKEMWFFCYCALSETDHRTWANIYRVKMSDWTLIGTMRHNFGHCNAVYYDADKDVIIMGNNPGHYRDYTLAQMQAVTGEIEPAQVHYIGETTADFTNGHYYWRKKVDNVWTWVDLTMTTPTFDSSYNDAVYIFYNVSEWVNMVGGDIDFLTIDKSIVDVSSLGFCVDAVFSENNLDARNIVQLVFRGEKFAKILLGMATNQLASGNYDSGHNGDGQYNGTYKVIRSTYKTPTIYGATKEINAGLDYAHGRIYSSNGHHGILGFIWTETGDSMTRKQIEMQIYSADGTVQNWYAEGICIDGNTVYQGLQGGGALRIIKYELPL